MARADGMDSPRKTKAALRRIDACRLRAQGYTFDEIRDRLGYATNDGVRRDIRKELKESATEAADDVIAMQIMVLEEMTTVVVQKALDGGRESLFAVDRVLAIQQRRAQLQGLDAKADGAAGYSEVDRWLAGIDSNEEMAPLDPEDILGELDDEPEDWDGVDEHELD